MLDHINILTLQATFSAKQEGELPGFLGSTIRGIIGHAFRNFVCSTSELECFRCEQRFSCIYTKYFSNTGQKFGAVNPYSIYVHTRDKVRWAIGETCTFDITIIGDVVNDVSFFLDALIAMEKYGWGSRRLKFQLEHILLPQTNQILWCQGKTCLRNIQATSLQLTQKQAHQVLVRFTSPMRILKSKKLQETLSFCDFVTAICRRIELLSNIYTEFTLDWDMEDMLIEASKVKVVAKNIRRVEFHRYSMTRKSGEIDLPGIEGWILFEGELTDFTAILEAGRLLQVGSSTTIGFGRYELNYDGS